MFSHEEMSDSVDFLQEKPILISLEDCSSIFFFNSLVFKFIMFFSLQEKHLNAFQRGQGEEESP